MATNYTGNVTPTLNNAPANSWATDAEKRSHVGNTYLVTGSGGTAGNVYAFEKYPSAVVKEVPASGLPAEIVTITDGGENLPMTSAEVSLSPIQDLNGYDSPWPAGGGKNLFDGSAVVFNADSTASALNGITLTKYSNGTFNINGTASAETRLKFTQPIAFKSGKQYAISIRGISGEGLRVILQGNPSSSGLQYTSEYPSSDWMATYSISGDCTFNYFFVDVQNGASVNFTLSVQIEVGSSATSWVPYSNLCPISGHSGAELKIGATYPTADNTYSVTFSDQGTVYSGTVYGGAYDFISGTLKENIYHDRLLSTAVWYMQTVGGHNYFCTTAFKNALTTYHNLVACTHFEVGGNASALDDPGDCTITNAYGRYYPLNIRCDAIASVDDFKTFLADNEVYVSIEAAPREYTLSPQQIETLLGENNVWSDAGEISALVYRSNQYVMAYDWFETWTMPKITRDNGNVIVLPYPQEYTPDIYDVDASTTGRNAAGTMIRDRVAVKHKFNYKFPPLSQADATEILNAVRDSSFTLTTASPETGAKTNYRVYVGDRSLPVYWMPNHNMNSWLYETLTLNLIEM